MPDNKDTIQIRFLGVRGSHPTTDKAMQRYGGNTTCHEVRAGNHLIILDAGTGIIGLGTELITAHLATKAPVVATLFFSHVHHDHTFGLLYFKPVYFTTTELTILGPKTFAGTIGQELSQITVAPFHPLALDEMGMKYRTMDLVGGERVRLAPAARTPDFLAEDAAPGPDDVIVKVLSNPNHTKLGVLNYRVEYHGKSYVFATDVEGTEEGDLVLTDFAQGADLLAYDAQYTREEYYQGPPPRKKWGHSTYEMACAAARKAGVKQLALIHHDPEHDDKFMDRIAAHAKKIFRSSFAAREGLVVKL